MERHTPTANGDCYYDDKSSYQDTGVCEYDENMLPDLLDSQIDSSLQGLDMGAIKKNSYDRTRAAMAAINPMLAKKVLPLPNELSEEEVAAIIIQAHFRGYLARKLFVQLLYEKFVKEEEEREAKTREQVEEGELLVENYRLNLEMEENTCLRKNLRRGVECDVITIQRAWRQHKKQSQDQLSVGQGGVNSYNMPNFDMDSQPSYSTPDSSNFHIRTNPFMGSNDNASYCDDDNLSDVFNDSLEQVTEENLRNTQEHGPHRHIYDNDHVTEGDTFNDELPGIDSVSSPAELPSPTTDWESIESCLTSEGETQELENSELLDTSNERLKHLNSLLKPKDLQICFVDDTLLSDVEGDEDGCVIKEYIIDKQDVSDEEKRDSGCVAGDEEMSESFSIKTVQPETLESHEISHEESKKVLLELSQQDSVEEEKEKSYSTVMLGWTEERLQELTLDELKALHKNMAQLIEAQNEVLVTELMNRDSLHLKQDSLLMDVEDASNPN
ncbi:uncharacterized protein LOC144663911 isoform X3 [Oculina patagonica]